ncbi:hypothetical protein [Neoroseomonas lacus]|uniref:Uncharacterized protein n=1 Tax=Neoroseomonas lacus TaxID=287609 RepID=A0A917KIX9_9PROT|nr:hypothetical protein [Neoroseomonas lacus]GGJ11687.1 hypothetical protein GCM10011320_18570 [Neoroseomonas lacus]
MLLGTILKRLDDDGDAAVALEAIGDIVLLTEVAAMAAAYDETVGEYVSGAARRFAADAASEDWLALMTAIERNDDPARAVLERMVRWSLTRDGAGPAASGCNCRDGGPGDVPR